MMFLVCLYNHHIFFNKCMVYFNRALFVLVYISDVRVQKVRIAFLPKDRFFLFDKWATKKNFGTWPFGIRIGNRNPHRNFLSPLSKKKHGKIRMDKVCWRWRNFTNEMFLRIKLNKNLSLKTFKNIGTLWGFLARSVLLKTNV
jgi:hypothetical protein